MTERNGTDDADADGGDVKMMERDAPDLPMRDCNAASGGGAGTWNVVNCCCSWNWRGAQGVGALPLRLGLALLVECTETVASNV